MGQNRKKLPCPKIRILTTPRSSIWAKNRINGYGAKSWWGPPRVHLEADGVRLGPKNGSKPSMITMPQNSNFWLLRGQRFWPKKRIYGYGAKSRWGTPWDYLGATGDPFGPHWPHSDQKMGHNLKILPCPKIRIFDYFVVINLGKKSNLS